MKITRKTCIFDFITEIIYSTLFISLLIYFKKPFGIVNNLPILMGAGAVIYYFLRKRNLDERDYYLYYKVNHFTLCSVILGIVIIKFKLIYSISGISEFMEASWAQLVILVFFFFHGLFGLILFLKK